MRDEMGIKEAVTVFKNIWDPGIPSLEKQKAVRIVLVNGADPATRAITKGDAMEALRWKCGIRDIIEKERK